MEFVLELLSKDLPESLLLSLLVFRHFQVVDQSLQSLGCDFGDVPIVVDDVLPHVLLLQQILHVVIFRHVEFVFLLLLYVLVDD